MKENIELEIKNLEANLEDRKKIIESCKKTVEELTEANKWDEQILKLRKEQLSKIK